MSGANASGHGAESVSRASRPSRSCPIGSRRPGTTACTVDNSPAIRIAAGDSAEQAAPHCKDPARLPDSSTLGRWAQRRLLSVWCWVRVGVQGERFLRTCTPTTCVPYPRKADPPRRECASGSALKDKPLLPDRECNHLPPPGETAAR
jgi:hypothetical protein